MVPWLTAQRVYIPAKVHQESSCCGATTAHYVHDLLQGIILHGKDRTLSSLEYNDGFHMPACRVTKTMQALQTSNTIVDALPNDGVLAWTVSRSFTSMTVKAGSFFDCGAVIESLSDM